MQGELPSNSAVAQSSNITGGDNAGRDVIKHVYNYSTDAAPAPAENPAVSALVNDIFGPSAKLIGDELKTYLSKRFDEVREQRRNQNLTGHINAVRTSLPSLPRKPTSYEQFELFNEWAEAAQDVNADDDEVLSNMWRELLNNIVQGNHVTKNLIETMRQVDLPMAKILLLFKSEHGTTGARQNSEDFFHIKRLEALGLLARDYTSTFIQSTVLLIISVVLYFLCQNLISNNYEGSQPRNSPVVKIELQAFSVIVLIVAAFIIIYQTIRHSGFRLTWTGKELLKHARKSEIDPDRSG